MPITVISKRVFNIQQNDKLISLLRKLRKHAKKQKGYISRSTFSNINDSNENIVISEWETVDHWKKWMGVEKVQKIQGKIDSLVGEKTVFEVYRPEDY